MSIKQQQWKKVEYSKKEITKAGKAIRDPSLPKDEYDHAIKVIDNWRAAHGYPLHVIYMHLRRMARAESKKNIIVVERLKRLESILKKIRREDGMDLWRMQDLGGCRFIVETIDDVYKFSDQLRKSNIRHEFKREYDYIQNPKTTGYRSLHLVFKYHSDRSETFNRNMLIEIQFRTHLQHLWATALETMDRYAGQDLKSGNGDKTYERFFVLVSCLFAMRERCSLVSNVPTDKDEIIHELESINASHILDQLSAFNVAMSIPTENTPNGYFVLILNYKKKLLRQRYYKPSEFDDAARVYSSIENNENSDLDVVMVRAESSNALKKAYPNYFVDIREFISIVKEYLILLLL